MQILRIGYSSYKRTGTNTKNNNQKFKTNAAFKGSSIDGLELPIPPRWLNDIALNSVTINSETAVKLIGRRVDKIISNSSVALENSKVKKQIKAGGDVSLSNNSEAKSIDSKGNVEISYNSKVNNISAVEGLVKLNNNSHAKAISAKNVELFSGSTCTDSIRASNSVTLYWASKANKIEAKEITIYGKGSYAEKCTAHENAKINEGGSAENISAGKLIILGKANITGNITITGNDRPVVRILSKDTNIEGEIKFQEDSKGKVFVPKDMSTEKKEELKRNITNGKLEEVPVA